MNAEAQCRFGASQSTLDLQPEQIRRARGASATVLTLLIGAVAAAPLIAQGPTGHSARRFR